MSRYFKYILSLLLLKLIIIFYLPITGDEAYFFKWARHLDSGYYDHPPMVGWIIYIMNLISGDIGFVRLFSFFTTLIVAYLIYKFLTFFNYSNEKSKLVSLIFLASPIDILLSLFTNDIPLLLFGTIGSWFLLKSIDSKRWLFYSLLSGTFLGLSFLSKYFAVFLMMGLFIYLVKNYKTKALKNIVVITLTILPFIAQNLYFNYNSCWNNILFNFFARTKDSSYHFSTLITYFVMILYIITPWGAFYLLKKKKKTDILRFVFPILAVGFFVFLMVALKHKIGLHWFLLFTPYIFLLFGIVQDESLKKIFFYNYIFSLVHIAIFLILIFIPKSLFIANKKYSDIIFFTKTISVCDALKPYNDKSLFATGYTSASVLSYYCKRDISMIFNNSKYGREDDKLLDVRELDKKDIFIFDRRKILKDDFKDVCQNISVKKLFTKEKSSFEVAKCENFSYKKYKERFLKVQRERFYKIPKWLPVGKCYFLDRYFK